MDKPPDAYQENKWVRPKEIKIGALLPSSGEGITPIIPRRRFKPQKKASPNPHVASAKRMNAFGNSGNEDFGALYVGKGIKTTTSGTGGTIRRGVGGVPQSQPTQTILSEEGGQTIWSSSARGVGIHRPIRGNPGVVGGLGANPGNTNNFFCSTSINTHLMARYSNSSIIGTNKLDSHGESSGIPSLLIEGNSVWNGDIALASQSLRHLSSCVKMERQLREQLEEAKKAKLQAFRSITNMFKKFVHNPSIRSHPEAKTIARCSVVTKTLTVIIQTFLRYFQSRQLVIGLRNQHDCFHADPLASEGERTTVSSSSVIPLPSNGSDYDRATKSVEDLLDEQEIHSIRQLYFDYYDCEVLSMRSPEMSNVSEFGTLPEDIGSRSSASQTEIAFNTSI